jgi:hypothetical protein
MIFSEETHRAADKFARSVGAVPAGVALFAGAVSLLAVVMGFIVVVLNNPVAHTTMETTALEAISTLGTALLWLLIASCACGGFVILFCYAYVDSLKPDVPYVPEKF